MRLAQETQNAVLGALECCLRGRACVSVVAVDEPETAASVDLSSQASGPESGSTAESAGIAFRHLWHRMRFEYNLCKHLCAIKMQAVVITQGWMLDHGRVHKREQALREHAEASHSLACVA